MRQKFEFEEVVGFRFPTSLLGQSKAFSHIYFIDGLLIDTGHSRKRKMVLKALKNLAIEQIFITHHHEDHTGNTIPIRNHFNCSSYASQACVELMKNPPALSIAQKLYWGSRPSDNKLISCNKHIETKNYHFDIIPIPGHAIDMVALYEPNRQWLFSADLYIHPRIGYFIYNESIRQQIESIKTILELDFKVMFCGHNPQFNNAKDALKDKLVHLESFVEKVVDYHQKGYSIHEMFKALGVKEFVLLKLFSGQELSRENMIQSVIRDYC